MIMDAALLFTFLLACYLIYDTCHLAYDRITRKPPLISESEALVLAQRYAEKHNYRMEAPRVVRGDDSWHVFLAPDQRPSPCLKIDFTSGEIRNPGHGIRIR